MTEKEMDLFFMQTLEKILSDMKGCLEYIKDEPGEIYDEIREGYGYEIEELSGIIESIGSIADLAEKDEETIGAVYDYLEGWYDNFVIAPESGHRHRPQGTRQPDRLHLRPYRTESGESDKRQTPCGACRKHPRRRHYHHYQQVHHSGKIGEPEHIP